MDEPIKEGKELLKEWYLDEIQECREYIQFSKEEIKTLSRIREDHSKDWGIVEVCREIIFYDAKNIARETNEINRLNQAIAELG